MPQSPYAKLRASINGAGVQTGGITVPASATVQLSADPTASVGATQYKYEIYGYPIGFTQPSGWSTDSAGVYYYSGENPPLFTLPTITTWGKFMLRLTVNNAVSTNPVIIPVSQLIDNSTALSVISTHGLSDVGVFESNQFNQTWLPPVQAALRAIETNSSSGSAPLKYSFLNLTGNFSASNIAILPSGFYLVAIELYLHTTGTSGSITANLAWTDRAGFGHAVSTVQDRGSVGLVVGNAYSLPISVDGVHNVTHAVTGISTSGALQYDLHYTFTQQ